MNGQEPTFDSVDEMVEQRLGELKAPSLVAGVVQDGVAIWRQAYGVSDVASRKPATIDTPYSLASISKPMVGTLLSIFVERGLISLNEPIETYLPAGRFTAWEGRSDTATVARVANHTSGLPLHYQFYFEDEPDRPPPFEVMLARYGNLVNPPGEHYVYSNLGYGILGSVLEHVGGKPLWELFQSEIYAPLGMSRSFFSPSGEDFGTCASRYDKLGQLLPNYVTDHPGASEAFSSLDDLLRFGMWHLEEKSGEVLSAGAKRRMRTPIDGTPTASFYGLGWALGRAGNESVANHSGGMDGVSTLLELLPDRRTAIAVMSNFASPLVEETLTMLRQVIGIEPTPHWRTEEPVTAPDELVGTWKGSIYTYAGDFDLELRVSPDGDEVLVSGEQAMATLRYPAGKVEGYVDVELDTSDAARTPHTVYLDLRLRGNRLSGVASTRSVLEARIGNALSYPAKVERVGMSVVLDEMEPVIGDS